MNLINAWVTLTEESTARVPGIYEVCHNEHENQLSEKFKMLRIRFQLKCVYWIYCLVENCEAYVYITIDMWPRVMLKISITSKYSSLWTTVMYKSHCTKTLQ